VSVLGVEPVPDDAVEVLVDEDDPELTEEELVEVEVDELALDDVEEGDDVEVEDVVLVVALEEVVMLDEDVEELEDVVVYVEVLVLVLELMEVVVLDNVLLLELVELLEVVAVLVEELDEVLLVAELVEVLLDVDVVVLLLLDEDELETEVDVDEEVVSTSPKSTAGNASPISPGSSPMSSRLPYGSCERLPAPQHFTVFESSSSAHAKPPPVRRVRTVRPLPRSTNGRASPISPGSSPLWSTSPSPSVPKPLSPQHLTRALVNNAQ